MIKSKKGGEKYLSLWWFFVLIIIAAGIVVGVIMFSVREVDVKKVESEVIISKLADCLIKNGRINEDFLAGNFNVLEMCYFDKDIISGTKSQVSKYWIKLEVFNLEDCELNPELKTIKDPGLICQKPITKASQEYGVPSFGESCKIAASMLEARKYPGCSERFIYTLNKDNKKMVLHISTGSNNEGSRAVLQ